MAGHDRVPLRTAFPAAGHKQYYRTLATPAERKGSWVFPREIVGSSEWLASLWSQREKIKDKPVLLLWGMKDIAFRQQELGTWQDLFTDSRVIRYDGVGHFVQEEAGSELCQPIEEFLDSAGR